MTTYHLRATGMVGALLPALLGAGVAAVGADAVVRAGGPVAWAVLVVGLLGALAWLRLPWALRLDPAAGTVVFLGPLRRTAVPAEQIAAISGSWTGGMNRWFLASVWVQRADRRLGFPLLSGFRDPEQVRDDLLQLNPSIRMQS
ncbi:hypothetical protein Athai_23260 [Actinocatenispora thailandica]|uniref:PH domain-containing protein n=1 Tax=Actinocatenispora thailandica TaxID=227318 RepID=A0A7R7HX68_9ACTN|nr:hypothetical protein [Actinocatenispora thailandica]BCJ34823.1 hypothetical protein Athai_23260 [Actinocatenispora thailandica]